MQWAPPHGGALPCLGWFSVTFGDLRSVATQALAERSAARSRGPVSFDRDVRMTLYKQDLRHPTLTLPYSHSIVPGGFEVTS